MNWYDTSEYAQTVVETIRTEDLFRIVDSEDWVTPTLYEAAVNELALRAVEEWALNHPLAVEQEDPLDAMEIEFDSYGGYVQRH